MNKFFNIYVLFFFIIFAQPINAHVDHYENLNRIEFDIYRNNKNIGKHTFSFKKKDDNISVESEINFEIKKLGVVLYKYYVKGTEIYSDGKLIKFNSKTNQNGKSKYVNIKSSEDELIIDGSSYKGKAPNNYLLGTWWNHSIIKAKAQISAVSGRIIEQNVTFLGKEKIQINGKTYDALHFNFSSSDTNLDKIKN